MAVSLEGVYLEMGLDDDWFPSLQGVSLELGHDQQEVALQSLTLIVETDPSSAPPEQTIPTVAIDRAPRSNWKGK